MKFFLPLVVIACLFVSCVQSQDCPENINKLPMYGGVKKCPEQIGYDAKFIASTSKGYPNRKDAAKHFVKRGWEYLYAQKLDTSMMRFNQAWLLDSTNYQIYWGFGNLLGLQRKYSESLKHFKKALKLYPNDEKVWQDYSISLGNLFFETKDVSYLNTSIDALKKAVIISPQNPHPYAQLTAAYTYFTQKDSAYKYLKITDQIDPTAIDLEVRKMLDK
ncbi:hypothetical protein NAF17_01040 [Mucilaginibacter sp. RB4R14]|uniref:tetratricopeptide repeat protein n=1 Tax=Mucilaginibacter aurantiaciroseus TaxID=2949308 RepID=UPI0020903440|nr:hypothetical protein [Mucilaginibacter aurantiaciroseus]MCO5934110.1 hypothetical protein [Mucilaginibacter aurantiaciroseus]